MSSLPTLNTETLLLTISAQLETVIALLRERNSPPTVPTAQFSALQSILTQQTATAGQNVYQNRKQRPNKFQQERPNKPQQQGKRQFDKPPRNQQRGQQQQAQKPAQEPQAQTMSDISELWVSHETDGSESQPTQ